MGVFIISGDIGGAKAILPVLDKLNENKINFNIASHRYLSEIAPVEYSRINTCPYNSDEYITNLLISTEVRILLFTTSVKDVFPLRVAAIAKRIGISVLCLLDNWMNYRKRLEIDNNIFYPDIYAVMDEFAYKEALKDNIPAGILYITGQPALASLGEKYKEWNKNLSIDNEVIQDFGLDENKKLIVFISEPVELDQGGEESKTYRGYTEKSVLRDFCKYLQKYFNNIQIGLVPHPREDENELLHTWNKFKGKLQGKIIKRQTGRDVLFFADAVAGMASILLYEAWLIGKPVASFQPNVRNKQLEFMKYKEGTYFLSNDTEWEIIINKWVKSIENVSGKLNLNPELNLHLNASRNIYNLILNLINKNN